jgi:hypothetical protein
MGNTGSSANVMGPAAGKQGMGGMIGGEIGKAMQVNVDSIFNLGEGISLITDSKGGGLDSNPFETVSQNIAPAQIGHGGFDYNSMPPLNLTHEVGSARPSSLMASKASEQGQTMG